MGLAAEPGATLMNRRILDRHPDLDEVAGEDKGSALSGMTLLLLLVAGLLLLNFLLFQSIFFSSQGILGFRNQSGQVEELEAKIRNLKEENQKLFRKIQAFKNSPRAQEKMVREELGWIRDNELLIEFQQKESQPPR
jgi:cell division protein FtsB